MVDDTIQPETLNLPINKEICFSDHKDQFKEKIMKHQTKILKEFTSFLKSLLEPGEEIVLSVEASSRRPFLGRLNTGLLFQYQARCVFIFTNKRILHFPTKFDFTPRQSVSQIRYGDAEEVKFGGFFKKMKIVYRSGTKETFTIVQTGEFKKLKTLEHLFTKNECTQIAERHSLCPRCSSPLLKGVFSCPKCHLEFKDLKEAVRLSIFFPGGGYFYTRHYALGVLDAIADGYFLLNLLANVIIAFNVTASWAKVLLFPVLLLFEKWISINHVKHLVNEYVPVDDDIAKVSSNSAAEPSLYQGAQKKRKASRAEIVFAIFFLIFGLSVFGAELALHLRNQKLAESAQRELPLSPKHQQERAALIESRYTRMDDYEKWLPVLYQEKDFAAIEGRLTDLSKDRSNEAEAYQLYTLYRTLGQVKQASDIEPNKSILDEWCSRQPESHIPWLLRGVFYTGYAWHIRGGGWAKDVPDEAWAKFEAMLHRAQSDLEKSYRLNPKDPSSSCQLLVVARGLGLSRDETERYFQNAISAFPFHYNSHYEKLNYLMPKWHGTQKEMNDFAMECMKSSDEHPYLGLITVAALEEIHYRSPKGFLGRSKNYLGRDDVWPTVEKIYEKFFVKYPEDTRRRLFYAYDACLARKFDVAIRQFEIIGNRWTEGTPWDSLNEYHRYRADAYTIYAMRLPPEQAVVALKKSIELDPFRTDYCFKLGAAATKLGRHDEAEGAYLKVLDIKPNCAEAHLLLCQVYEKTNDPAQAKYHAEKALQCNPTEKQKRTARNYIEVSSKGLK